MNPFLNLLTQLLGRQINQQPTHYNPQGTQSLEFRNSLAALPLYNDLGQLYAPGVNAQMGAPEMGNWLGNTAQSILNNDRIFNQQIPPLHIFDQFLGPQRLINPDSFDLGSLLYGI